jgi:hypothetical protein
VQFLKAQGSSGGRFPAISGRMSGQR